MRSGDLIPGVTRVGDAGFLVTLPPVVDIAVNERALAIAAEIQRRQMPGVLDVVPAIRSVGVHVDAADADWSAIDAMVREACLHAVERPLGRHVEIDVQYGGDAGPDLEDVAGFAGIAVDDVVRRHTERTYRVFMLGFLPGFAYLGTVDPCIAAPRRQTPRAAVPAGAVGIAGAQTGIYPRQGPGGWQIIGRADVDLSEVGLGERSLLAPGDTVAFRAVPSVVARGPKPVATGDSRVGGRHITVIRAGLLSTVQDLGRWGYQHLGVSVSGAMDRVAHRAANRCVGNRDEDATLEVTISGPELRFDAAATIAVAGADLSASLDGTVLPLETACSVPAGATLRFGERRTGARAYVAFDGGLDVPAIMGSRSTHPPSGVGGVMGRALRSGDRVPLGTSASGARASFVGRRCPPGGTTIRVLPGAQADLFDADAFDSLTRILFTVSSQSNRMAYRLTYAGGRSFGDDGLIRGTPNMISDVTFAGSVQVTPAGDAILLMADRQTTGGYPQLATVISADLSLAAQLAPGDDLRFAATTNDAAHAARLAQERDWRVAD